ncbi:MAG: 4-hydroxythreonine-4-phosphate dehydrogenase PdxA [Chloroflexi bacterium]|nr:4-hydroxythreonine-4-phosphate dehydrogenase PdxA [Chloroflexota bacterium]
MKPKLAITIGDAAGVGPEVTVKAMPGEIALGRSTPVIYGDARIVAQEVQKYAPGWGVRSISSLDDIEQPQNELLVMDLANCDPAQVKVGEVEAYTGRAAYESVVRATEDAIAGGVDAIVTAPLNKEAMHKAGFKYDGHTGLLGHLTGTRNYFMVLGARKLKVIHVSTHVSVADAVGRVKSERIQACIAAGDAHIRELGIAEPRIAVCGLNPHAGENRLFGDEDEDEIRPAAEAARAMGINARGPLPADSCIRQAYEGQFDLVVVMYHDQGHVPMKLVAFSEGVNVTVGLPIIRTSVDHGTAFDIAGQGIADPANMTAALDYAYNLAVNRSKK